MMPDSWPQGGPGERRSMCYGPAMGEDVAPEVTRRDLLRALALGSVAVGLAGCGAPLSPSPTARASPTTRASAARSAAASAGASAATPARPTPVPSAVVGMTLREKIGQLLVVGFRGLAASKTSPVGRAIAAGELGGIVLFDRNIASPDQVADLTDGLAQLAPAASPLLVALDQEGGRVARLGPSRGFPAVPSQKSVGARDEAYAAIVYNAMATTLSDARINLNLAPVVDLNVNATSPAIGALDRSFSADPAVVSAMARAAIRAHHGHGVLTTIKHFPGLGSAVANTDVAVADVSKTWRDTELQPYRDLVGGDADCVMVGHMINKGLDPKYPASLSHATVDVLLRGDLGWQGPVVTDDLQAAAITRRYKRADAIAGALGAGVDLLLFGSAGSDPTFYTALVDSIEALVASGEIEEARIDESVARVALLRAQL